LAGYLICKHRMVSLGTVKNDIYLSTSDARNLETLIQKYWKHNMSPLLCNVTHFKYLRLIKLMTMLNVVNKSKQTKQNRILHPQGLVTIQVNILSMYKHIQGRTSFFTPAHFKSCLFFKFLLIYSKPCLVQLPRPYSFQKIS
jgi:hypothetical protein